MLLRETWSLFLIYALGDHIYFALSTVTEVSAVVWNSVDSFGHDYLGACVCTIAKSVPCGRTSGPSFVAHPIIPRTLGSRGIQRGEKLFHRHTRALFSAIRNVRLERVLLHQPETSAKTEPDESSRPETAMKPQQQSSKVTAFAPPAMCEGVANVPQQRERSRL